MDPVAVDRLPTCALHQVGRHGNQTSEAPLAPDGVATCLGATRDVSRVRQTSGEMGRAALSECRAEKPERLFTERAQLMDLVG